MRKRTIVTILAVLGLLALVVAVQPVFACTEGCTPGYWKQEHHWDSWPLRPSSGQIVPSDFIAEICNAPELGCLDSYGDIPTNITLIDALTRKGGGENAFLRHGAAALLNALHPDVEHWDKCDVCGNINAGYDTRDFEYHKDLFAVDNELGCPLD